MATGPLTSIQLCTLARLRAGLTQRELADAQQVSRKAIRMRVYRARRALRKQNLSIGPVRFADQCLAIG